MDGFMAQQLHKKKRWKRGRKVIMSKWSNITRIFNGNFSSSNKINNNNSNIKAANVKTKRFYILWKHHHIMLLCQFPSEFGSLWILFVVANFFNSPSFMIAVSLIYSPSCRLTAAKTPSVAAAFACLVYAHGTKTQRNEIWSVLFIDLYRAWLIRPITRTSATGPIVIAAYNGAMCTIREKLRANI